MGLGDNDCMDDFLFLSDLVFNWIESCQLGNAIAKAEGDPGLVL